MDRIWFIYFQLRGIAHRRYVAWNCTSTKGSQSSVIILIQAITNIQEIIIIIVPVKTKFCKSESYPVAFWCGKRPNRQVVVCLVGGHQILPRYHACIFGTQEEMSLKRNIQKRHERNIPYFIFSLYYEEFHRKMG